MTNATWVNRTVRKLNSCCSTYNTNRWYKQQTFCRDNFLTPSQIKRLARLNIVNVLSYKGKYQVRWVQGFNRTNYIHHC